jgi:hypothetical protein
MLAIVDNDVHTLDVIQVYPTKIFRLTQLLAAGPCEATRAEQG